MPPGPPLRDPSSPPPPPGWNTGPQASPPPPPGWNTGPQASPPPPPGWNTGPQASPPPPPGWGNQPHGGPPAQPKKGNGTRIALFVVLGLVLLVGGCGALAAIAVIASDGDPDEAESADSSVTALTQATPDPTDGAVAAGTAPLGTAQTVGDYEVTVIGYTADGTAAVMAANEFNDPPSSGTYAVVELSFTYDGAERGSPYWDLSLEMTNGDGQIIDDTTTSVVCPNDWFELPELAPGGTATASVCLDIATYQDGILTVEPLISLGDEGARWDTGAR